MALRVIGTGFGRTGTNSLRLALEQLGFGPCHHMFALREHPAQLAHWQAAARGETPDWDAAFEGWGAAVDWPSAAFWRQTTAHFPQALVIHSTRSPESWHRSVLNTILPAMEGLAQMEPGPRRDRLEMARRLIVEQTFGGRMADPEHAMAVYRAHEAEVLEAIPPGRLLVYRVGAGWEPLCAFLGVPVPDAPFPETNSTAEFTAKVMPAAR
jgi:hypothetical protein